MIGGILLFIGIAISRLTGRAIMHNRKVVDWFMERNLFKLWDYLTGGPGDNNNLSNLVALILPLTISVLYILVAMISVGLLAVVVAMGVALAAYDWWYNAMIQHAVKKAHKGDQEARDFLKGIGITVVSAEDKA